MAGDGITIEGGQKKKTFHLLVFGGSMLIVTALAAAFFLIPSRMDEKNEASLSASEANLTAELDVANLENQKTTESIALENSLNNKSKDVESENTQNELLFKQDNPQLEGTVEQSRNEITKKENQISKAPKGNNTLSNDEISTLDVTTSNSFAQKPPGYNSIKREVNTLRMQTSLPLSERNESISGVVLNDVYVATTPVEALGSRQVELNNSVQILSTPELSKGSNKWHFGIQAGYFIYPGINDNGSLVQGPTAGIAIGRNLGGPWRITSAINWSTVSVDDLVIDSKSEPGFGFGREERTNDLSISRLHMLDLPLSISRKTGPVWLSGGVGVEWLMATRGSINQDRSKAEYSLKNEISRVQMSSSSEEVWVDDEFLSKVRFMLNVGADVPVGKSFEIGIGMNYYFSSLAEINDPEISTNLFGNDTRLRLQAIVKYWIK